MPGLKGLLYPPLVLPLLEVVACPEGDQVGVVGGGGVGDAAGAADVGVAELVGEALELIGVEVVVVPEHVVMGGAARALGGYGGAGLLHTACD